MCVYTYTTYTCVYDTLCRRRSWRRGLQLDAARALKHDDLMMF